MSESPDDFAAAWAAAEKATGVAAKEPASGVPDENPTSGDAEGTVRPESGPDDETADREEGKEKPAEEVKAESEEEADDPDAEPGEVRKDRELAKLKSLAEKYGFKVEGETVSVDERAQFRAERRKSKEALRAERDRFEDELRRRQGEVDTLADESKRFKSALEAGDVDAMAQLAGFKTWNDLNQHVFRQKSSPEAKRIEALQKELKDRSDREEKQAKEREQKDASARIERERREYFSTLSDDVDDFDDDQVRALGKVEGFKEIVLRQEQEEYDPNLEKTIPRDEAIKRAKLQARKSWEALNAVFGKGGSEEKEAAAPKVTRGPGGKPVVKPAHSKAPLRLDEIDTSTPEGERKWYEMAAQTLTAAQKG